MVADWFADDDSAIARGSVGASTSAGTIDWTAGDWNAIATPIENTSARMPSSWMRPASVRPASTSSATTTKVCTRTTMRRRSYWSATCPAGNSNSSDGTNWASPISPRSNARPVIA